MQNEQLVRQTETANTELPVRKPSPFLQLAQARARHRKIRIGLRLPLRQPSLTRRAMLAALREAEFAQWLSNGGDFLRGMHQPIN